MSIATKKKSNFKKKIELNEDQKEDIKNAFQNFAQDRDSIDVKDLKIALRALGFEPKKEEIKRMIAEVDIEKTGRISFNDFQTLLATKMAEKDTNNEILKAFSLFDHGGKGAISFSDLQQVAQELGENLSDAELQEMLEEADRDADGLVNQAEFFRIMKKSCLY